MKHPYKVKFDPSINAYVDANGHEDTKEVKRFAAFRKDMKDSKQPSTTYPKNTFSIEQRASYFPAF